MTGTRWFRLRLSRLLLLCAAALGASAFHSPAYAEDVTVKRHVTVREQPTRRSDAVKYPAVGEALTLLDNGARVHGYFHVRLSDGRTGWVYSTFVARSGEAGEGIAGAQASDVAIAHFVNMDQGNATLLEFPCGAILIDAGGRDSTAGDHLIAYLNAFFARRADLNRHLAALFVTHTHVDHNRALRRVAEAFSIDGYVDNGLLNGSGSPGAKWMANHVSAQVPPIPRVQVTNQAIDAAGPNGLAGPVVDPVNCPRVDPDIRVLAGSHKDDLENPDDPEHLGWPDGDLENGNNHSLVIRVAYGKASFLFTGDLEEPAIETLVAKYQASNLLNVDVWEVGHHGSQNGTTASLLAAMSPEIAVISMGDGAIHAPWSAYAYGHPRRSAVTMIAQAVSRVRPATEVLVADKVKHFSPFNLTKAVYATGWNGDIDIIASPDGTMRIKTEH